MDEEKAKEEMKKALSECFDVKAVTNVVFDQVQNAFLKGIEIGIKIGKGSEKGEEVVK